VAVAQATCGLAQVTRGLIQTTRALAQATRPQGSPLYPQVKMINFIYLYEVFIYTRLPAADDVFSKQGF
jgi:hypothetical protein